jgi:hypothetical protein
MKGLGPELSLPARNLDSGTISRKRPRAFLFLGRPKLSGHIVIKTQQDYLD